MLKKMTVAGVSLFSIIVGVNFYNTSEDKVVSTDFFDRKNPYSRKPASIGKGEVLVKKEEINKKVVGIENRIEKLATLKGCYTKKCEFSSADSREYDLSVGQSLKKELLNFYEEVLTNEIVDERVSSIARDFLKISNGHVKEAALLLISTQGPSQENLDSIVNNVLEYHDANLVGLALMELEKYKDDQYEVSIKESFVNNFTTGSLMVKEALAKGLYRFVNEDSRNVYGDILESLPKGSRVRRNLKASLDRYDHRARL